ncbi:hypothetical protein AVEN_63086-1 [Araneus ventricosus]|uniref:Uncharacterized protein n=2 Tax=Araneus ventricosus TaxID=182803 RepID=A0A4Y2VFY9_ARAVE|nr:hypothetical protein AVEN_63086-1 [Araneus ventricosus]
MSSHNKYPLEKQDTPSESSDSHSDSEVNKAEENLEQLKIKERQTKDYSGKSKPLDSPNQEGALSSKNDLLNEPIAGPSGLQEPRQESSDPESKAASLTDPQKEKDVEAKGININIEEKMVEGDYNATDSAPPSIQSSTGVTPSSELQEKSPVAGPSRVRGEVDYSKLPFTSVVSRFMRKSSGSSSSSSRRIDYVYDGARTLSDVSEIRSEIADSSAEGSVYHDAPESFEEDQSSSYASAVETQSSGTSDTNISELQDDSAPPPTPPNSSVSISTPSGEQGHRAYLERLQIEADARGEPMSTSSGIGSTNQSELAHLEAWNMAGEIGPDGHNVVDPNQDVPDNRAQGGELQPTSESVEDEPILVDQQMQAFDRLFEQEQRNEENREEPNVPRDEMSLARRIQDEERVQACSAGAGSPKKRRRSSKCISDLSSEETGAAETLRPRFKPDTRKKSKMAASKSSPTLQSSSESTEPKSSSSDHSHRVDSPEIKSSSESQEFSKSEKDRKPWQTPGHLRGMQLSTISPKDSVIAEDDRTSPLREQDTELMATEDPTPEKMETTLGEGAAKQTEPSESKPVVESSDLAYGGEADGTLKEHEQSFEASEFERRVGKSKREPKLSSSPPSDKTSSSSHQKAATSRPKKRARSDKMPLKARKTRHDNAGTVPKSLGNLQQSESTSTPDSSDYTPSDDEKETEL